MTQSFATDANNDLFLGDTGRLVVVSGIEAVRYACESAARTLLGEMVLAVDQGVPYFETVWAGSPDIPRFEGALRQRLLGVVDVVGIASLVTLRRGDVLGYSATIRTIYGLVNLNG